MFIYKLHINFGSSWIKPVKVQFKKKHITIKHLLLSIMYIYAKVTEAPLKRLRKQQFYAETDGE